MNKEYKILSLDQRELLKLIIRGFVRFGKYKDKNIHLETFFIHVMIEFGRISGNRILRHYASYGMYSKVLKEFREILEGEVGEKVEIRHSALGEGQQRGLKDERRPSVVTPIRRSDRRGAFIERSIPPGNQ